LSIECDELSFIDFIHFSRMVEIDDLFEYFVRMVIKDMMFVSGNGLVTFVEEVLLVFDQLNELVRDP